jgi:SAM-dependent methyltransferase
MTPSAKNGLNRATMQKLAEGLLRSSGQVGVKGNLLEVHHPSTPFMAPAVLQSISGLTGLSVSLSLGKKEVSVPALHCDSSQLPFQDKVFQIVVLHHVVRDGDEPELEEAVRVLARDGVLILLGLNSLGWRFRVQERAGFLPGMSPLKVKTRLKSMGMAMRGFAGAGLFGRNRPAGMHRGFASLGAPLADVILLQAVHANHPEVTPLRFSKAGPGIVQSAAMHG